MNNLKKVGLANIGSSISRSATGVAVALVMLSGTAFATAIGTGQGNSAGTVLVNSSGIFFSNFTTVPSPTCTSPGCTGSYTNATGTVQGSLSGAATLTPNIVDWAEFSGTVSGLIKIDLNTLNAGYGTALGCTSNAIGSTCTPSATSPITLVQVGANSVSISLSGNGIAYTGTSASGSSPTIISFTSQNNVPGTITGILAAVNAGGFTNSVSATYSSTGPTTVPEPMTLSMMGLGLVSLGLIARRRKS
jgi:hypothetical protein